MMDYAIPADYFPLFELAMTETPTTVNPLGVKGIGDGHDRLDPAVYNAVMDARALRVGKLDMPLTPERVWRDPERGVTPCTRPLRLLPPAHGRRASALLKKHKGSRVIAGGTASAGHEVWPANPRRSSTSAASRASAVQTRAGSGSARRRRTPRSPPPHPAQDIARCSPRRPRRSGTSGPQRRTIGDSVAHADPAADFPTASRFNATIVAKGAQGRAQDRRRQVLRGPLHDRAEGRRDRHRDPVSPYARARALLT
jgi:hypothetical protein